MIMTVEMYSDLPLSWRDSSASCLLMIMIEMYCDLPLSWRDSSASCLLMIMTVKCIVICICHGVTLQRVVC